MDLLHQIELEQQQAIITFVILVTWYLIKIAIIIYLVKFTVSKITKTFKPKKQKK